MAGANDCCTKFLCRFQRLDPLTRIPVAGEVVRSVYARVTGEQDFFFGQPGKTVAVGMGYAEMPQLDPMLAVVEDHVARVQERRRLEFARRHVLASLS